MLYSFCIMIRATESTKNEIEPVYNGEFHADSSTDSSDVFYKDPNGDKNQKPPRPLYTNERRLRQSITEPIDDAFSSEHMDDSHLLIADNSQMEREEIKKLMDETFEQQAASLLVYLSEIEFKTASRTTIRNFKNHLQFLEESIIAFYPEQDNIKRKRFLAAIHNLRDSAIIDLYIRNINRLNKLSKKKLRPPCFTLYDLNGTITKTDDMKFALCWHWIREQSNKIVGGTKDSVKKTKNIFNQG